MLPHSLTKVWRVQIVKSQSNPLNLLFFYTTTRQEATLTGHKTGGMLLGFSCLFGTWVRLGHRDGSRPALHAEHCAGAARRRPARRQTAHSGRHGLQQHPSRAGGDARRARGGAAAGRRSGWDPAHPVHRLAGSARQVASGAGAQKTALGAAIWRLLPSASKEGRQIRLHRYQPTAGSQEMNMRTSWRKRSPTGWHLRTFELDTKAVGRAISKSATGTSAVIPGSRSDLWSDLTWPDIVMFICQSYVLKQFVGSQSYASFTVISAK